LREAQSFTPVGDITHCASAAFRFPTSETIRFLAPAGLGNVITTSPARLKLPAAPPRRVLSERVEAQHRALLRSLPWPDTKAGEPLRSLGLTSCRRRAGVSTVATQLAVTAAACGAGQVLLVDAHLAWPGVSRQLRLPVGPGLSELLLEGRSPTDVIQPGPAARLSVLTAGGRCDEAAVFDSPQLGELVETLEEGFDLVLFDLPSVGEAGGALRLAGLLDGVLLVLEAERVRWQVAQRARQLLLRAESNLLGAVLNKHRRYIPEWLYRRIL
jgi:Mrp family chromosome partitioning ATPase